MYELKIVSNFSAAHQLKETGGRCEELHGHNWKVEVYVKGNELDQQGMLIDFAIVKDHVSKILSELDHNFLNELQQFKDQNPSSENIAKYIFSSLQKRISDPRVKVSKVTAWESETACASYYED